MSEIQVFGISVSSWIIIPVAFLVWITLLLFSKRIILKTISRVSQKTRTHLDDILIKALDFPLTLLIVTSGGLIVERILPMATNTPLTNVFLIGFKATTIVAIVLFVDKFLNGLLLEYSKTVDILKTSGGIARGFVRLVVIGLGFLILLDNFGVSITPILASLGIGSLAVALALQPTLENFFAGIQIIIDKPFQLWQFVKLESGEQGTVYKIGWRSTWIKMPMNNVVVIPNKLMVTSKVVNFDYPDPEIVVTVEGGVHYASNLEEVERVTLDVAKETLREVKGAVTHFEPSFCYHTFDHSSINFTVALRARGVDDMGVVKHDFIKRLHERYKKEGIIIPFPIYAINLDQEKAFEKIKKD